MLLGPPAGGKGTQAGYLAERYGTLATARLDGLPPKKMGRWSLELQGIFEIFWVYTFIGLLNSGMLIRYYGWINFWILLFMGQLLPPKMNEPHLKME